MTKTMDDLCVNTIRTLAMDAVQRANSGHPGTPMALAPVVYCLWQRVLRSDPSHSIWPNRDRFVLSAGHASMRVYDMLHLTGVRAVNPKYAPLGQQSVTQNDPAASNDPRDNRDGGRGEGPGANRQQPERVSVALRRERESLRRGCPLPPPRAASWEIWPPVVASTSTFTCRRTPRRIARPFSGLTR